MFVIEFILSAIWAAALALTFLFHWQSILTVCGILLALFALSGLISNHSRKTP